MEWPKAPPSVPHKPRNLSQTEPVIGIVCRNDPNEQESVVLRPDLENLVPR